MDYLELYLIKDLLLLSYHKVKMTSAVRCDKVLAFSDLGASSFLESNGSDSMQTPHSVCNFHFCEQQFEMLMVDVLITDMYY